MTSRTAVLILAFSAASYARSPEVFLKKDVLSRDYDEHAAFRGQYGIIRSLARNDEIPLSYFREVSEFYLRCRENPQKTGLCGDIKAMVGESISNPARPPVEAALLRVDFLKHCTAGFQPMATVEEQNFFVKIRFLTHLVYSPLYEKLQATISDRNMLHQLKSLQADLIPRLANLVETESLLRLDSTTVSGSIPEKSRLMIAFFHITQNFKTHYQLYLFSLYTQKAGSLLENREVETAFIDFEMSRIMERAETERPGKSKTVPYRLNVFRHNLKQQLKNAVMFYQEPAYFNPGLQHPSFMFEKGARIPSYDSMLISSSVYQFGRMHYRLGESSLYTDASIGGGSGKSLLDSVAELEIASVEHEMSDYLRKYLNTSVDENIRVILDGEFYPDVFTENSLAEKFRQVYYQRTLEKQSWKSWISSNLPFLSSEDLNAFAQAGALLDVEKECLLILLDLETKKENYLRLLLCRSLIYPYDGSRERLRKVIMGWRQL